MYIRHLVDCRSPKSIKSKIMPWQNDAICVCIWPVGLVLCAVSQTDTNKKRNDQSIYYRIKSRIWLNKPMKTIHNNKMKREWEREREKAKNIVDEKKPAQEKRVKLS